MSGFRHLIVPHGDIRRLRGEDRLIRYRFGTGAADHLFCGACGVKSFYQPRSHLEAWSVNLNALDDPAALKIAARPFDGRHWESANAALDGRRRAAKSKNHRAPDSLVLRQKITHNCLNSSKPRLRERLPNSASLREQGPNPFTPP